MSRAPWFPALHDRVVVVAEQGTTLTGQRGEIVGFASSRRGIRVHLDQCVDLPNPLWFRANEIAPEAAHGHLPADDEAGA